MRNGKNKKTTVRLVPGVEGEVEATQKLRKILKKLIAEHDLTSTKKAFATVNLEIQLSQEGHE